MWLFLVSLKWSDLQTSFPRKLWNFPFPGIWETSFAQNQTSSCILEEFPDKMHLHSEPWSRWSVTLSFVALGTLISGWRRKNQTCDRDAFKRDTFPKLFALPGSHVLNRFSEFPQRATHISLSITTHRAIQFQFNIMWCHHVKFSLNNPQKHVLNMRRRQGWDSWEVRCEMWWEYSGVLFGGGNCLREERSKKWTN